MLLWKSASLHTTVRCIKQNSPFFCRKNIAMPKRKHSSTKCVATDTKPTSEHAADTSMPGVSDGPSAEESTAGASGSDEGGGAVFDVDITQYEPQLTAKVAKIQDMFSDMAMPSLEIHTSEPIHYRMRAEFTIWHEGDDLYFVMFDTTKGIRPAPKVRVDTFPVASKLVNEMMPILLAEARADKVLGHKLFQVNFHTTLSGQAMLSMLYHKKLDPATWNPAVERLRRALAKAPSFTGLGPNSTPVEGQQSAPEAEQSAPEVEQPATAAASAAEPAAGAAAVASAEAAAEDEPVVAGQQEMEHRRKNAKVVAAAVAAAAATSVFNSGKLPLLELPHVVGRSRKQKITLDQECVHESLQVNGTRYIQKQVEGAFSQPNGGVCEKMLSWAQEVTRGSEAHDMLELYCGNGNFTVPLASNFRRVVATEISKSSVDAARFNLTAAGLQDRVFLARMSSEDFAEVWRTKGTKRRLEGLSWDTLDLKTVLVDPPRAGLDDFTVQLVAGFDRVVYISCNPETLHANLEVLIKTHDVARFACFDQFPYTRHFECGVYLVKREGGAAVPEESEAGVAAVALAAAAAAAAAVAAEAAAAAAEAEAQGAEFAIF